MCLANKNKYNEYRYNKNNKSNNTKYILPKSLVNILR